MNALDELHSGADRVEVTVKNLQNGPRWRLYLLCALLALVLAYFLWLKFGTKPLQPGAIIQAQTAKAVADMEHKAVMPARLMVLTPKAEAVKRLKLPAAEAGNADEEIIDSVAVPATRYGSTSTTFVNLSSGESRTVVRANDAPWFSFLRDNAVGVEYGTGKGGTYYQADYRRDILQIKGVVLGGRLTVKQNATDSEFQAGVRAEYRW